MQSLTPRTQILDIWNSRPFRSYRESALSFEDLSAGCASCADEESPAGSECSNGLWSYGVFSWLD